MKYTLCILLLLVVSTGACKKDKNPSGVSFLSGSWNWVMTRGGIAGMKETPASTGTRLKYTFRDDSSVIVASEKSTNTTSYHIYTATSSGITFDVIAVGNDRPCELTHYSDTLVLHQYDISDGYDFFFVRE